MLYSKLFGKTVREAPSDASNISYKLLYRAGFIRESSSGRFFILPLGQIVQKKIMGIIKKEMDKNDAQEMISPVLHPIELWEETNRTKTTGFELMKIKDRKGAEFALGGTAEEMFVDVVRKFQISYKDLPFNIYQFSLKFRDEMRSRGGLLRVREFIMKDAYSFDIDETSFKKTYLKMREAYRIIFEKMGLKTDIVESDNGYIGGDYCHEFVVESQAGETTYLCSKNGKYFAHKDIAVFKKDIKNIDEPLQPLKKIKAERGSTMLDGVKFHKKPLWQQIKDVLFVNDQGKFILALTRGDYEVNEVKLKHVTDSVSLRHGTDEEIRKIIRSEPGFISPVNIKQKTDGKTDILIVADTSLRTIRNAYGGANKKNEDLLNINIDRDYRPDIEADIVMAKKGYLSNDGGVLIEKKGIEIGNIFQLGLHYSTKMKNATFANEAGKEKPYYMGCYGIGIGRTMAAVVEKYHDDRGIAWPKEISPYQVHLVGLDLQEEPVKQKAMAVYKTLLENGIEVLFDDRIEIRAGEKFSDCDLIGIPLRIIISKKTGNMLELKERLSKNTEMTTLSDLVKRL